jgi:hypothetical protein
MVKYRDTGTHLGGPIVRDRVWFFTGLIYRGRSGTQPGQPEPAASEQFLDRIADTSSKLTWKITDRLRLQQTFYAEMWGTVNPPFTSPTRPIETLQHSRGNAKLDGNYGSQLSWTPGAATMFTARYNISQGGGDRIGFFEDLTTPHRRDQVSQLQSGNTTARQFRPRRDEASVKVETHLRRARVEHNLSYGVQIARSRNYNVDIQPGGVIYLDLNGRPDQAQFVGPDVSGAVSSAQGVWTENETTIGRFTLKYGGRYDRMVASSQDIPHFDGQFNRIGTLEGLGRLITWHTFSPRAGVAVRLTADGRTALRFVAGRYYLPLFLGEFEAVHPGRALTTTMRYDPATADFKTLVSITDPRAQIRIDPDMDPPYTDQVAVGLERELANNLGVAVNVVYKRGASQLGWRDIGGVYGEQQVTLSNDQQLTVFPLRNRPADRIFLRTNGPGFATTYKALILTATRRLSDRWQFTAGYTRQRAAGLELGGTAGRDPNDYTNANGGLGSRDRPHMFSLMGSYETPEVELPIDQPLRLQGAGELLLDGGGRPDVRGGHLVVSGPDPRVWEDRGTGVVLQRARRRDVRRRGTAAETRSLAMPAPLTFTSCQAPIADPFCAALVDRVGRKLGVRRRFVAERDALRREFLALQECAEGEALLRQAIRPRARPLL